MTCTRGGWACTACLGFSVLLIALSYIFSSMADPNGELQQWYTVEGCFSSESSFAVADRGTWDAYLMRPTANWLPGSACPTVDPSVSSEPNEVTLEYEDGWRADGSYKPIFLLPTGAYATMAIEITNPSGGVVFPTTILSFGPDAAYPWQAPESDISAAEAIATQGEDGCTCTSGCSYNADGQCDDGGDGAEFSMCGAGTDCGDCGSRCAPPSPSSSSRMLLDERVEAGVVAGMATGASALYAEAEAVAKAESLAEAEVADAVTAPTSRKLLKGGSSGGGGAVAGGGGRSATRGTAAWGGAAVATTAYRGGGSSHRASYGGRSVAYGGRSTYAAGGRRYYGGARGYNYMYGRSVILYGAVLYTVGYGGYGCYSCTGGRRNCQSCSNCRTRRACGGYGQTTAMSNLDRYQIDLRFDVPAADGPWPLKLKIYNTTTFLPRSMNSQAAAGSASYINFFTDSGDSADALSSVFSPIGYISFVVTLFFIACNKKKLCPDGPPPRSDGRHSHQPNTAPPAQMAMGAYPQTGQQYAYAQSAAYPAGQPVAVAYGQPAMGQPPVAMAQPMGSCYGQPVATGQAVAYPQQVHPQQYGAQPVAVPMAYPSNPPSPPGVASGSKED